MNLSGDHIFALFQGRVILLAEKRIGFRGSLRKLGGLEM